MSDEPNPELAALMQELPHGGKLPDPLRLIGGDREIRGMREYAEPGPVIIKRKGRKPPVRVGQRGRRPSGDPQ